MNLTEVTQELKALHEKLNRIERRYNRTKWIFKPVTILGFIALAITTLLPFLLPFTAPIILAMVAAFLLRLIVYKYIFGDPESKFNKAVKETYVPAFVNILSTDSKTDKTLGITAESINKSRLFLMKADTVYHEVTFIGSIEEAKAEFGQITIANDDITFGAILKSFGDDFVDGMMGLDTEFGHEKSLDNKKFFKGFYAEIALPKNENECIVIGEKLVEIYQKKSPFVKGWHAKKIDETTFWLMSKNNDFQLAEGIVESLKSFEKAGARKVFISIMKNQLTIAFPWGKPFFKPSFEDKNAVDESFVKLFSAQAKLVRDLVNNSL